MNMFIVVNKNLQNYDYMTEEYTQPLLIDNTFKVLREIHYNPDTFKLTCEPNE